jgi:hypothetical protein
MMKVALISFHSFLEPGGVKTHVLNLAREFEKRKIDYKIVIPRRKINENYGKNVILLGTSFPLIWGGGYFRFSFQFYSNFNRKMLDKRKIYHFAFPQCLFSFIFSNPSFTSFFQNHKHFNFSLRY